MTTSKSFNDSEIASAILHLCDVRGMQKTICPSEVARLLTREDPSWRALMPDIRRVAAKLAAQGQIATTQRGKQVDAEHVRGPIRLGLISSR
ncbi:MAG: DUF3253 domain-containing protein [Pseudomonadota bacterium]